MINLSPPPIPPLEENQMTYCKQHQWKMWIPPEIYHCYGCGLYKFKFKKEQANG